jgi:drug/metabolite transporter (DMT)-like permease
VTVLALLAAFGAAVAFGLAAVLQGIATGQEPDAGGLDPRLLLRLLRRPAFLASLALNLGGFGLHITALQTLPLFLVQSVIATSVAVTAVLSVRVFQAPLRPLQWAAVVTACAGLALLAPSAASGDAVDPGAAERVALLVTVLAAAVLGVAAGRLAGPAAAVALGLLAGVGFGVVAVSARLLPDLAPAALLTEPVTYLLLLAGAVAFLLYTTAMQRGSVTTTTAAMVVTQTAVPALVGIVLLGDRVRPGWAPVAVAGFALALAGALGLATFEAGAPSRPAPDRPAPDQDASSTT